MGDITNNQIIGIYAENTSDRELLQNNYEYLVRKRSDLNKARDAFMFFFRCITESRSEDAIRFLKDKGTNALIRVHSTSIYRNRDEHGHYAGERMAVYTVLFGNRDVINEPKVIDENCDYYVVTDQPIQEGSIWEKIEYNFPLECSDNVLKNRYFKILFQNILSKYRYSMYIDANIILYGKPTELVRFINPKTGIALHNHPHRCSVYEEIYAREHLSPEDCEVLEKQKKEYKRDGFKSGNGLFECNVIIRENTDRCRIIMEKWWEEFKKFPKRDQVSFPYVLWKNGIDYNDIGILGNDFRLNPYFRIIEHVK